MKTTINFFFAVLLMFSAIAQQEFHVSLKGKSTGDGSLENPWDLQTALNKSPDLVNGDDIIWLHQGIYQGRFVSNLQSTKPNKFVTVAAFGNDKVVLDGNVESNVQSVLQVKGKNVIYKNFDITFIGNFNRNQKTEGFVKVDGLNHVSGVDCKFINLRIYDNPGSGFGSWKNTGGSQIKDCLIFNNGFQAKSGRGSGVGLYVQNNSDDPRLIENNIIFNNYYKGIEVWSANKNANASYVKNVTLRNNVAFNNGTTSGGFKDNLIIGTDDKNGVNIAKNIRVENNIFYHNTDVAAGQVGGDAASVTIGFKASAPVENVVLKDNLIIGRNNAFRVLHAKSLTMENNIAYCGYVHLQNSILPHITNWKLKDNTYYTKRSKAFRVIKDNDYAINEWKSKFKNDSGSEWLLNKQFKTDIISKVTKYSEENETFNVSVLNPIRQEVVVDFSDQDIKIGSTYNIFDIENPDEIIASGILKEEQEVIFNTGLIEVKRPSNNNKVSKTISNFGVFVVKFNADQTSEIKEKSTLGKLLDWLGID